MIARRERERIDMPCFLARPSLQAWMDDDDDQWCETNCKLFSPKHEKNSSYALENEMYSIIFVLKT